MCLTWWERKTVVEQLKGFHRVRRRLLVIYLYSVTHITPPNVVYVLAPR